MEIKGNILYSHFENEQHTKIKDFIKVKTLSIVLLKQKPPAVSCHCGWHFDTHNLVSPSPSKGG